MHMTFEQIPPPEHPAISAARAIKQMHLDTIAQMDEGFVYMKDGVNVNDRMREACAEQIKLCEAIIDTSQSLPAELLAPIELMLVDAQNTIEQALQQEKEACGEALPEIGNYDHKT